MTRHRYSRHSRGTRRTALLLLLPVALSSGCSDTAAPPATGALELRIVTVGDDIDPDGFLLSFGGGPDQAVPANGTWLWDGPGGTYTLAVTGLAFNCSMTSVPAALIITTGQRTRASVQVSCSAATG
jgi:hypothetical protein